MKQEIKPIVCELGDAYLSGKYPKDAPEIACYKKHLDSSFLNCTAVGGPAIKTEYGAIAAIEGGVTTPAGFRAAGVHAGFRDDPERLDFALVLADEPCATAATFTRNVFCAAPVSVSKAHLSGNSINVSAEGECLSASEDQLQHGTAVTPNESEHSFSSPADSQQYGTARALSDADCSAVGECQRQYGTARALIINSGNANAATGTLGLQSAERSAQIAADAIGCTSTEVLVASTGVIGVHMPLEPFEAGVPAVLDIASNTRESAHSAARAIMTTDTVPKEAAYSFTVDAPEYEGITFTVGGMAKGSGMIMPNMATMISVITTDAPVRDADLYNALRGAVNDSFNKVTVDSDTSTNDSCFVFASGKAGMSKAGEHGTDEREADKRETCADEAHETCARETCARKANKTCADEAHDIPAFSPAPDAGESANKAYAQFCLALQSVCNNLARKMAADGEGATKLITVHVFGAANDEDADKVARTIANSPLVKTAIYGHDCNWGRIAAAAGRSGAKFDQSKVDIDIMGIPVCRGGLTVEFDEEVALREFERDGVPIHINLHAGSAYTRMWTCDFTHDYITINGDYRT